MSLSKAASSSERCLEPICLIDLNDTKVNGIDALRKLLSTVNPKCKLVCISIAGRRRAGKSTLLCFFIRYLEARCRTERRTDVWMEHARDEELGGFPAEHGTESVTRGILIWPKLFKIEENVAVLLMDTQGIFDDMSTIQHDTILISLSLLLSSVQIFNIKGDLDRDCIENLDIFTKIARLVSDDQSAHLENSSQPFQELIILLRDWANRDKFEYGWTGGQNRLNASLEGASAATWNQINKYFEDGTQCFLMPRPGDEIVENGSRRLIDMKGIFKDKVKEFIERIFRPSSLRPMKFDGEEITCEKFADVVATCVRKVEDGKFPTVRDIASSVANEQITGIVERLEREYSNTISQLVDGCPFEPTSLEIKLKNESEKILKAFDASRKIEVAEITKAARQTLAEAIELQNKTLRTTNATTCSARMTKGAVVGGVLGGIEGGAEVMAGIGGIVAGPPGIVAGAVIGAGIGAGVGAAVGYSWPLAEVPDENSTTSNGDSRVLPAEWKEADVEAVLERVGQAVNVAKTVVRFCSKAMAHSKSEASYNLIEKSANQKTPKL